MAAAPAVASRMPPKKFNPVVEAKNYSMIEQRQAVYDTPQYQSKLAADSINGWVNGMLTQAADPGRFFIDDLCWSHGNGCAGDIRLNNWATNGYGLVRPVLFTARNGATISGHVWATVAGPRKRPGIVITPGSVQADEQLYWYAAQALAKEGYVVLTFDAQGQGMSDTYGQGRDRNEGVPAQTDGRPFYDGTEDALNFFLSTPQHPYKPVSSCSTGTSHAAKQRARVTAGLDSAYNPFWQLLNPKQIGLAGHSYGAAGVSYIGQWDPRVKAIVAWDDLGGPGPNKGARPGSNGGTIGEADCPAHPADRRIVPIRKPALGMSADYGLPPLPNTSLPNPNVKSVWSLRYTKAGVDTGEIIVKGGSHLDFSFIPNQAFGASLRGIDMITWYTVAWFDRYLKHKRRANAMLLTERWRHDPISARVDPNHDGNAFSFYYFSRLDFHLKGGGKFHCEDLRDGCAGMVPQAHDGYPGTYSYLKVDTTPDSKSGPGAPLRKSSSLYACPSGDDVTVGFAPIAGEPITSVTLYLDGHRVGSPSGTLPHRLTIPGLPGTRSQIVRLRETAAGGLSRTVTRTLHSCSMSG
jgi:dienelactone hydrolase